MRGRFKYLGSRQSCNVCGGKGQDCRELHDANRIIYFCRGDNPNPDYLSIGFDRPGVFEMFVDRAEKEAQDQETQEERERRRQEYIAAKKARKEREAKEYAEGLPVELRDRELRKVISQLPLLPHHRADLERRGLSPEQIDQGMFRSVSKNSTDLNTPVHQYLPGAWSWGKSFRSPVDGYICPIFNEKNQIIGAQVRADDASDSGKYLWLKTQKSSHLQNGELPLTIHVAAGDQNLRLAEGILKPRVAYFRRRLSFAGAAGGNFSASSQQLKKYIDNVQPQKIILCPDAGSRANKNVLRQYRAIAQLLKSWNLTLWIEDWGQGDDQSKSDVDEISPDTATNIIPFSEWDVLRQTKQQHKSQTITKKEWWEKCKFPREAKKLAKFVSGKFKKFSQLVKPRPQENKGFSNHVTDNNKPNTTTTAITLWQPPLKLGRPYIEYTKPGDIPTHSEITTLLENENWLIKQPEIKFDLRKWGDAPATEAIAKGWNLILDKHGCGEGKSHIYGALTTDKLEGMQRTVFAATNHRNPTVETVEQRKDLIAKHNGLTYDNTKHTPLGNPYQIATPSGQLPDIAPPCVEHKLFNTAYALQLNAYSGKGSPICQKCPMLASGCEYLEQRRETLGTEKIKDEAGNIIGEKIKHPDIRADLNGLNKFDAPTALIVDEIDQTLESSKPLYITKDTIARGNMRLLTLEDKKLARVLQELCQKVYQTIDNYTPDNIYGDTNLQVIEKLADINIPRHIRLGSDTKYQQYLTYKAKEKFNNIIEKIYSDKLTNPQLSLWGEPEYTYKVNRDPITGEITTVEETPTGKTLPTIPSIDDLITQCQTQLQTNFDNIIDSNMTPGEKAEALELNHTLDFLSPILKIINGYTKISLSLSKNCLTITKPWYRHQDIIKSAKVNIFLDATIDVADLKRELNLDKNEPILTFSSLPKDHSNLTLKFIPDFGHASNLRRSGSQYCETERITAIINQIAENHKNEKIGLIDRKAHAYSHKLPNNIVTVGHWGNDSRGSNQFLDCTAMINIGDYMENLGALAAKWQCKTGQIVEPSKLTGGYGRYVLRRRIADLEQVIGRVRATNRPDEQLTIYMPGKWTDTEINAIASRLPGVNIEKVATYDICPTAAKKGQQTEKKIFETFFGLTIQKQNVTQEKIAQIVGLTRGRVAQVCKDLIPVGFVRFKKMLVMLWDTLSKTNNPEKALSELPEEAQWFILEWLPNFHEYVQQGETLEEVAENIETVVKVYGPSILDYVSVDTIIDLIKLFMAPMPITFWEELRMQAEPIPIPMEN